MDLYVTTNPSQAGYDVLHPAIPPKPPLPNRVQLTEPGLTELPCHLKKKKTEKEPLASGTLETKSEGPISLVIPQIITTSLPIFYFSTV